MESVPSSYAVEYTFKASTHVSQISYIGSLTFWMRTMTSVLDLMITLRDKISQNLKCLPFGIDANLLSSSDNEESERV